MSLAAVPPHFGEHELSGKAASVSSPRSHDAIRAGRNGLASEGAQLQDADLPSKLGGKFHVFGNAAFEADATSMHLQQQQQQQQQQLQQQQQQIQQQQQQPATRLMNNLFDSPANVLKQRQQQMLDPVVTSPSQTGTPRGEQQEGSATPRLGSLTKMFRRGSATERTASVADNADSGTMVQAFNSEEEEEHAAQGADVTPVPRTPQHAPGVSSNPYAKTIAVWEQEVRHLISTNAKEEAFSLHAPSTGLVRCCVKRVKAFFGGTTFQMHLENGDVFLMAARKRKKSKVSSYILSQDEEDIKRDTDNCMAKLKANFVGTEYMLWGRSSDRSVRKGYASEKLCINFKQTALMSAGGPRAMYVVLPTPDSGWQPTAADGSDSLSNSLELARSRELPPYLEKKMAMLCTKPPEFDELLKGYTLDFQGRVKEASVKNFQLVGWDHNTDRRGSDLIIQFGKVDSDTYALDFTYPLTIELAFAVALASIDTKLCYTM